MTRYHCTPCLSGTFAILQYAIQNIREVDYRDTEKKGGEEGEERRRRGRREAVNVADTGTRVILNNEDSYSEKCPVPKLYYTLRLLFQLFSRWARTASVGWMETVSVACASCVVFTLRTTRYHPSADRPFRTSGRTKRILKIVGKEIALLSGKCFNQLVPGTTKK